MIPRFNNFEAKKSVSGGREILPTGGYVCKILNAEVLNYSWGSTLVISFDIIEGNYKDFWRHDYNNQMDGDKKWRGTWRINLPSGDGSQQDVWKQNAVNNLAAVLEECNPGYTWDWDENHLKGKVLGILYREFEWELNGNSGISTEAYSCTDLESIRAGKFKIAKCRKLKRKEVETPESNASIASIDSDDDDLPF